MPSVLVSAEGTLAWKEGGDGSNSYQRDGMGWIDPARPAGRLSECPPQPLQSKLPTHHPDGTTAQSLPCPLSTHLEQPQMLPSSYPYDPRQAPAERSSTSSSAPARRSSSINHPSNPAHSSTDWTVSNEASTRPRDSSASASSGGGGVGGGGQEEGAGARKRVKAQSGGAGRKKGQEISLACYGCRSRKVKVSNMRLYRLSLL